ncbi:MAG: hypothetical protein PHI18_01680, partial [bacterium]|nr:hypothetical protein [bacterium]
LLDERVAKVRRRAIVPRSSSSTFVLAAIAALILLWLTNMLSLWSSEVDPTRAIALDQLENLCRSGTQLDIAQAYVHFERAKLAAERPWPIPSDRSIAILLASFGIFFGIPLILQRLYPLYNFCWGDYVDHFRRRETTRKWVLSVIVVGVVVSFIGSLLASRILR